MNKPTEEDLQVLVAGVNGLSYCRVGVRNANSAELACEHQLAASMHA